METIEISQSEADPRLVREKLNEYNFNLVPHYNHQELNLVIQREGELIAGLGADTYWNWLYVSLLWVDERERGHGLGGQLLAKAEEIARQWGCKNANLETHDFQNLAFYQKRGYEIFGQLENVPEGHIKYYLRKRLTQEG